VVDLVGFGLALATFLIGLRPKETSESLTYGAGSISSPYLYPDPVLVIACANLKMQVRACGIACATYLTYLVTSAKLLITTDHCLR
jgi:hypothetical protein